MDQTNDTTCHICATHFSGRCLMSSAVGGRDFIAGVDGAISPRHLKVLKVLCVNGRICGEQKRVRSHFMYAFLGFV